MLDTIEIIPKRNTTILVIVCRSSNSGHLSILYLPIAKGLKDENLGTQQKRDIERDTNRDRNRRFC